MQMLSIYKLANDVFLSEKQKYIVIIYIFSSMLSYLFGKTISTETSTPPTTPTTQHPPPYETLDSSTCKCDPCTCEICECDTEQDSEMPAEDCKVVRGKWIYDGCSTIEEMIERLQQQIEHLKSLQNEGWNVSGITKDDYTFMYQELTR